MSEKARESKNAGYHPAHCKRDTDKAVNSTQEFITFGLSRQPLEAGHE